MSKTKIEEIVKYRLNITPERSIEADLRLVPLKLLKLDPRNVRFKHMQRTLTDKEMEDAIWNEKDTRELYNEIKFSRGLSEAPLIDSTFNVREGNRRIVCLRKLVEDIEGGKVAIAREKLDPVQCIVFPEGTPESDVAIYLTRVHVSGKKEWRAMNQAAHIYDLYNVYRYSYEQIREAVSVSKQTAINMEQAYKRTLEYHTKYPNEKDWLSRYSYFYELYKSKMLRAWAEKNDNVEQFMQWIYEGKFERGERVRDLPKIIRDPEAFEEFRGKGDKSALDVLSDKDPAIGSATFRQLVRSLKTVEDFPRSELLDTIRNKPKLQLLERLHSELGALIKDIKSAGKSS